MGEEVKETVKRVIETWARRQCQLAGIDPDADWREIAQDNGALLMLDVAVAPEDRPNWRHLYGRKAERLLAELRKEGVCLSRDNSEKASDET